MTVAAETQPTTGAAVLRGGLWNALSGVAAPAASFFVSIVAARVLHPAGMGRQSFIAFVVATATVLLTAGVPYALMRYVAELVGRQHEGEARALIRRAWHVEIVAAAVGAAVVIAFVLSGQQPRAAWFFGSITCALGILNAVPAYALKGFQRWRTVSLVSLGTTIGEAITVIVVLLLGGGITGMFAVGAAATAAYFIWATVAAKRILARVSTDAPVTPRLEHDARRYALFQTIGIVLTLIVWQRSEFFFLKHYSSDAQIAFYSVPFAVLGAIAIVPQSLATAIAPAFATLVGAEATHRLRSGLGRAVRLLLLWSLPTTALTLALGPLALRVIYGHAYRHTMPVVLILASLLPLSSIVTTASGLFLGLGIVGLPLLAMAAASVVNLSLDFLLIPAHGAIGAAIANVAAQLTAGIPLLVGAVLKVGGIEWYPRRLTGAVVAAAIAGSVAYLPQTVLGDVPALVTGAALGLVALLIVGTALRILAQSDAEWLEDAARGRLLVLHLCRAWSPQRGRSRAPVAGV